MLVISILSFMMVKFWQGWHLFEGISTVGGNTLSAVTLEVNLAMSLKIGKAGTQQVYY